MITIKTKEEIEMMREGGKILGEILRALAHHVKPGITTNDIDIHARDLLNEYGVKSSFLGYNNFPAVVCTSVNDEVVHGIPSDRVITAGDVLKIDMGVLHKGFHTDSAVTVIVPSGEIDGDKEKLLKVTKEALSIGISQARAGNTTADIGQAVQDFVEAHGFNVPRELIGHGIGRELHEPPEVPNYKPFGKAVELKPGMTIAIEPMVLMGSQKVKEEKDVYVTKDGKLAAHFEHTIAITDSDPLILTE